MPEPIERWRVFIAIELPDESRKQVMEHTDRLRSAAPDTRASWSRQDNLHLTLKFLGDTLVTAIDALSNAAQHAARSVKSFELVLGECGAFPPNGQPRVLWVGIHDSSGRLQELHKAIEDECYTAGFALESRPFHPHLTVARLRSPQGSRQLAALHKGIGFTPISVTVSALCLFRSELSSRGSKHTLLTRHDLLG